MLKNLSMRNLLDNVTVTQPPANVARFPVDALVQKAVKANGRVVECQGEVARFEMLLEQARKSLLKAEGERTNAQRAMMIRLAEDGALEGISDCARMLADAAKS